jgi:uncharacterized protein YecE (DUF72 family)
MKRLREAEEPLERLFTRALALGPRFGPVLYQLPAALTLDLERLHAFLRALPRSLRGVRLRHAIEFRHPSWYVPETFEMLDRSGVALCLHDKSGSKISGPFVGPFVYVRFHGSSGDYRGSYSNRDLDAWGGRLVERWQDGREVYAYFNNDADGVATPMPSRSGRAWLQRSSMPFPSTSAPRLHRRSDWRCHHARSEHPETGPRRQTRRPSPVDASRRVRSRRSPSHP